METHNLNICCVILSVPDSTHVSIRIGYTTDGHKLTVKYQKPNTISLFLLRDLPHRLSSRAVFFAVPTQDALLLALTLKCLCSCCRRREKLLSLCQINWSGSITQTFLLGRAEKYRAPIGIWRKVNVCHCQVLRIIHL
jgi:hypothetical protein